ncbi:MULTISPECIES: hypothetical protein [Alteromonadaceae]|uniref:Uncharacterized protein n=1 Tax=Brumicola blandensis TaxID=3075611 RepID=A0AAW8QXV3_9ALTE|nr:MULTISPECIES: hypothetical protein [unclassified Alteromonas]MDT0581832.1 hypothetical protein [Alteromonas sp. W409]MDT0628490.1 hypothetical protein [Alteromonas sp. W364]
MSTKQKLRPFQRIMRKHAKSESVQQRQSDLLMQFSGKDHEAVALLLKEWLKQSERKDKM